MHQLLLFVLASLTLNLVPGPDMLYILARTVSQDKQAGLLSTAGISTGLLFHTLAAASGLSLIILQSAIAFTAVKLLGAGYLIFMGIKMLLAKKERQQQGIFIPLKMSRFKIFKQGFLTNVLNPKISIFFIAFLPQFVETDRSNIFLQMTMLGLVFIVTGTLVNATVVLLAARFKALITNSYFKTLQEKITGVILVALGIKVAW